MTTLINDCVHKKEKEIQGCKNSSQPDLLSHISLALFSYSDSKGGLSLNWDAMVNGLSHVSND